MWSEKVTSNSNLTSENVSWNISSSFQPYTVLRYKLITYYVDIYKNACV